MVACTAVKRHSAQHTWPQGVIVARVGGEKQTGQTYVDRGSGSEREGNGNGSDGEVGMGGSGDSVLFRFLGEGREGLTSGEFGNASTSMGDGTVGAAFWREAAVPERERVRVLGPGSSARFSRPGEIMVILVSARPSLRRLRGFDSPFVRPTEDARVPLRVDLLPPPDKPRPESVASYIDWCRDSAAAVEPSSSMTLRGGLPSSEPAGTADTDRELR